MSTAYILALYYSPVGRRIKHVVESRLMEQHDYTIFSPLHLEFLMCEMRKYLSTAARPYYITDPARRAALRAAYEGQIEEQVRRG